MWHHLHFNNMTTSEFKVLYQALDAKLCAIEDAVFVRKIKVENAIDELLCLADQCEQMPLGGLLELNTSANTELCTRFSALYLRLLTDFDQDLQLATIFQITLQKRFIIDVFETSGFKSSDCLLKLLNKKASEKKTGNLTDNQALVRSILMSSIGQVGSEDLASLMREKTEISALLALGLLLDRLPANGLGEANRKLLLEQYNPYDALRPLDFYGIIVSNVWMVCSYSNAPRKHNIKKHLNQWFRRVHQSKGLTPKPPGSLAQAGNVNNKPVMAVVAEKFTSIHAMYRWYAPIIKRLKNDYYMVLVALRVDVDDKAIALFDNFLEVPQDAVNIQSVLNQCTPDIAYFTSLGMRTWSISLANMRWAPLQVMSLGHPATTHCEHMDLAFINTRTYCKDALISESLLVLESEIGSLIEAPASLSLPGAPELSEAFISIAVPCNLLKINVPFLTALKEIERLSEKPLHFMFFPNVFGIGHLSTEKRIHGYFPDAIVVKGNSYENYLKQLNQNHLALSPFPFGNATSTIDCMLLGLPVIGLLGSEPHSRSDYDVLAAFDLQDYCIADSVENYVERVLRYINKPEQLKELRELIASKNFHETHWQNENPLSLEFCDALKWAFEHKDEIVAHKGAVYQAQGRWKTV